MLCQQRERVCVCVCVCGGVCDDVCIFLLYVSLSLPLYYCHPLASWSSSDPDPSFHTDPSDFNMTPRSEAQEHTGRENMVEEEKETKHTHTHPHTHTHGRA